MIEAKLTIDPDELSKIENLIDYKSVSALVEEYPDIVKCESPIERLLFICLEDTINICLGVAWAHEKDMKIKEALLNCSNTLEIYPQHCIDRYRVDFLIRAALFHTTESRNAMSIVIECDGHDYHERTKFQAFRDKKRDRDIIIKGYRVLRFTGSEIWADPELCANAIGDFFVNEIYRLSQSHPA
jgi:very-short-patch-repair endonuclease